MSEGEHNEAHAMPLERVEGRLVTDRTIAELERALLVYLTQEVRSYACNTGLVAVLCDAVRLCREHVDAQKSTMEAQANLLRIIHTERGLIRHMVKTVQSGDSGLIAFCGLSSKLTKIDGFCMDNEKTTCPDCLRIMLKR